MSMMNDIRTREDAVCEAPMREDTLSSQIMRLHDIAMRLDEVIFYISNNLYSYGETMKDGVNGDCAFTALQDNVMILEHALKLAEGISERL